MKRDNNIIRSNKRENPYVLIDKYGLNDEQLSFKAKGILAYILSKPDYWQVYESDLVNHAKDGRDSVRAGLRELEKYGYIEREKIRNEEGMFSGMRYTLHEQPIKSPMESIAGKSVDGDPLPENPSTDFPATENPTLVINDLSKNDLKIDCLIEGASAEIASAHAESSAALESEQDEIYDALQQYASAYCYVDNNIPMGNEYIAETYLMLVNQFNAQLSPEVVRIACELYFERACTLHLSDGVLMRQRIENPVGFFQWCYKDAIKKYKASRNKPN